MALLVAFAQSGPVYEDSESAATGERKFAKKHLLIPNYTWGDI